MIWTVMGGVNPAKVLGLFSRQGHSCFPIHTNLDRHLTSFFLLVQFFLLCFKNILDHGLYFLKH